MTLAIHSSLTRLRALPDLRVAPLATGASQQRSFPPHQEPREHGSHMQTLRHGSAARSPSQSHPDSVFPWQGTGCVARSFSGCGGGEQSLRRKHAHHRYPRHVTTTRIMLGCHQGSSRAHSSRSPSARFSIHIRRPSRGRVNFKPPCTSPRPTPRRQGPLTSGTVTVTVATASG